jgi:hypothetical protein
MSAAPIPSAAPARPPRRMAWLIAAALTVPAVVAIPLLTIAAPAAKAALVIVALLALATQVIAAYLDRDALDRSVQHGEPVDPWWALLPPVYLSRRGHVVEEVDDRPRTPMWFSIAAIPVAIVVGGIIDAIMLVAAMS